MEKDNPTSSKVIQTYAEDMAKVIQDDTGGLVKKIIHGEEEHEAEKKNLSPEPAKNKFFMLISFLLISVASILLLFFFFKKNINTLDVPPQFVPLIFSDKSDFIEVAGFDKDKIAQTFLNQVRTTKLKGVEGIYLTNDKKVVGLRKFLTIIQGHFVPGDDNFVQDNFLLGVISNDIKPVSAEALAGKDFFILLKVRSLADVFDRLRAWENKMFFDLHGFFGVNTSAETNYLFTKNFDDGIVQNKNARILYDNNSKPVLMYIFADDTSIIITGTDNAAGEIMLRLAGSQIKK